MFQLVYVSSVAAGQPIDIDAILSISRRNNRIAGLTGMLYADARRFLQVLEGEEVDVIATFERIKADPRHRAVVVLSRRHIAAREFGAWEMAHAAPGHDADALLARVEALSAGASPTVRATFAGFVEARRAA
ncbi:activator of photopigment and puc with BLUF domain protein [Sphingomonas spermidinifaciens]|uniref:Activator of photopigment and puc with BLUF domain protein n=1 Tax=Sphingomonas spermidinifaciens TaxID=1141889 RepID=A0A2A4B510_9SPHN|nr:BLUF domain-containing protein [Sphingomonas spermidinifaciens]PCD03147.1 activator of photopigment and puc with BLUF domain protein [Sphingomonas spermidinifaciens]